MNYSDSEESAEADYILEKTDSSLPEKQRPVEPTIPMKRVIEKDKSFEIENVIVTQKSGFVQSTAREFKEMIIRPFLMGFSAAIGLSFGMLPLSTTFFVYSNVLIGYAVYDFLKGSKEGD